MPAATLEKRIARLIGRKRSDVFMRSDFKAEGGYDQVGRALKALTKKGQLIHLGRGLYGRASSSPIDGKPMPVKGLKSMAEEALRRLGVKTYPSAMTTAYNKGRTTQVPSGRVIGVDRRVRRKIGVNGTYVRFERARADAA